MRRAALWRRAGVPALVLAAAAFGCREDIVAPGRCPELCPSSRVQIADTTYTGIVVDDSSYTGYVSALESEFLLLSDVDSLQGVGVARFNPLETAWIPSVSDTLVKVGRVDSVVLSLRVVQRDTTVRDVRILVYRLPFDFDTALTFADAQAFLADSLLVDSVAVPDTLVSGVVTKLIPPGIIDTLPEAEGRVLALAFRVRAPTPTAVSIAAVEDFNGGTRVYWYTHAAAPRDTLAHTFAVGPTFDAFVQPPAQVGFGGALIAGGMPAARTLLRLQVPAGTLDSVGLVRATLILTPTRAARGRPGERFRVSARGVVSDFGAKSIVFADTAAGGTTEVVAGDSGEVRIEIGRLLRAWGTSTGDSIPRSVMLLGEPEGLGMGSISIAGRTAGAAAPRLQVTFVRKYTFGVP